jgi:hypothetical protein
MSKRLQIRVSPDWSEMVRVNETAHAFLEEANLHPTEIDTYTMVACELVENGIKYGESRPGPGRDVELVLALAKDSVTVHVTNAIGRGSRHHLKQLDWTLQWVRGFQDPFQAYIERVKEISREPSSQSKSGLGIVRIAYEARAAIDFVVGEDDTLCVSAVAKVSDKE